MEKILPGVNLEQLQELLQKPLDYPKIWRLFKSVRQIADGKYEMELAFGALVERGIFALEIAANQASLKLIKGGKLRALDLSITLSSVAQGVEIDSKLIVRPVLPVPPSLLQEISAKCEREVRSDLAQYFAGQRQL